MIPLRFSLALVTAAALSGCAAPQASTSGPSLVGTWQLSALQSSDDALGTVHPDDPAKYEMKLTADGRAVFRLGCNRASGHWSSAAAGRITFSTMAMTRAMCPAPSLDTRIARELGFVRSYVLSGDRLTLVMMADGGTEAWVRTGP